jgi:hypothetical protein
MIAPVRCDYFRTKLIYNQEEILSVENNNYIFLNESRIVLQDYKTMDLYGKINIDIPIELKTEIEQSLKLFPRDYLFVSTKTKEPYKKGTFNKWANRTLKKILNNKHISLVTLRHIYLSRRDLKIENKSIEERKHIANIMGHSLQEQEYYMWHKWNNL